MEEKLSRRERQIMDILYARGRATAGEVGKLLPAAPGPGAVRTMLSILEQRGHIRRSKAGRENVYEPSGPREEAGRSALERVLRVFFGGSVEQALSAHLVEHTDEMSEEEFARLTLLIKEAKERKGEK